MASPPPDASTRAAASAAATELVIDIRQLATRFGDHVVHRDINLQVHRAEVLAIIGGSGSGKSTLLREMILLHRPSAGSIKVLGVDLKDLSRDDALDLRLRWGVLFQHGGLFGSLTVLENIGLPLREHSKLSDAEIDDIAAEKLALTGLKPEVGAQYPAQLSGGMMKRASQARALALDPELLFLDEPTAGLDPQSAAGVDELVLHLRDQLGLTIVMISHDLDLLWHVTDRVAVLGDGTLQAVGTMAELSHMDNPWIKPFFEGVRGRAAETAAQLNVQPKEPSSKPK
jgi:phospholipid/cholesterol/gamma-HCH transport system ATP-binding protein